MGRPWQRKDVLGLLSLGLRARGTSIVGSGAQRGFIECYGKPTATVLRHRKPIETPLTITATPFANVFPPCVFHAWTR